MRMMRLSQHFCLEEFTRSEVARLHGINNVPDMAQIENMTALCYNILEPVRKHFKRPVNIKSGFRSARLNKAIAGSPNSQHMKGEAVDIEIDGTRNAEIWEYIYGNLPFDQLIAEQIDRFDGSEGWIHVSYRRTGEQRKDAISYLGKRDGKHVYVQGLEYVT